MKRIFHHYEKWEEHHAGMWRKVSKEKEAELLQKAIEFTGNAELYGSYMILAVKKWIYSCEHNLTCSSMNRQAWVGHAACCIAINCPEYITRLAWHQLSQRQQDEANAKADHAIRVWERRHKRKLANAKEAARNQCAGSRKTKDRVDVQSISPRLR